MQLSLPYNQAFAVCREALNQLPRTTLKQENQSTGVLVANCGMTWKSFGEKIVFNIQAVDNKITQVEFASSPTVSTTLLDYGKNLENAERLKSYLTSYRLID
ncbi:MAG: hypothetical protein WA865_08035 [Spirulinaceae cyanobacterium]